MSDSILQFSNQFPEREELIEGILVALLAREHIFVLGPPGTAKSLLARTVAKATSLKYFDFLLTRYTTPEELFGPISLEKLKKGIYQRVTRGKLPEAELVFLDEIWKANSAILNTLLSAYNERIFHNPDPQPIPLRTLIAASNEVPTDSSLRAIYDRLLLRYEVGYLSPAGFKKLMAMEEGTEKRTSSLEFKDFRLADKPDEEVIEALLKIRISLAGENMFFSDRRFHRGLKVVRTYVGLQGRKKVTVRDLQLFQHMLWDTPKQRLLAKRVVLQVVDPEWMEALELYEAAESNLLKALDVATDPTIAAEAAAKTKETLVRLQKVRDDRVKKLIARLQELQSELVQRRFGI